MRRGALLILAVTLLFPARPAVALEPGNHRVSLQHGGRPRSYKMLAGFEKIDALAGAKERVVVGHAPEVASRFDQVEPGIVKIA